MAKLPANGGETGRGEDDEWLEENGDIPEHGYVRARDFKGSRTFADKGGGRKKKARATAGGDRRGKETEAHLLAGRAQGVGPPITGHATALSLTVVKTRRQAFFS